MQSKKIEEWIKNRRDLNNKLSLHDQNFLEICEVNNALKIIEHLMEALEQIKTRPPITNSIIMSHEDLIKRVKHLEDLAYEAIAKAEEEIRNG